MGTTHLGTVPLSPKSMETLLERCGSDWQQSYWIRVLSADVPSKGAGSFCVLVYICKRELILSTQQSAASSKKLNYESS